MSGFIHEQAFCISFEVVHSVVLSQYLAYVYVCVCVINNNNNHFLPTINLQRCFSFSGKSHDGCMFSQIFVQQVALKWKYHLLTKAHCQDWIGLTWKRAKFQIFCSSITSAASLHLLFTIVHSLHFLFLFVTYVTLTPIIPYSCHYFFFAIITNN